MKLSQAVDLFLVSVRADGLSDRTRIYYQYCLRRLLAFLGDPALSEISTDDLRQFMVDLRSQTHKWANHQYRKRVESGLSPYTIVAVVRAVKRLFNWLEENEHIRVNPAARLRKGKLPPAPPKDIRLEDFRALLAAARKARPYPERDYAILLFLMDTGCRVGGLVGVRVSDLDLANKRALVTEKGRKSRFVFFTNLTRAALREWLALRPPQTDYVFVGERHQLSTYGISDLLRRLKKSAGIKGRVNAHSFRHAYAKSYLKNGGDLASLSDMLGHSDVMVTKQSYSVFTVEELQDKHEQHSPLASILDG